MGAIIEQVDFSDKNEYLERDAIVLAHATAAPVSGTDVFNRIHIIIMAYALTANAYNYLILRYGVPTLLTTKLVKRVRAGLDKLDMEAELERYPDLMLWIVATCAMASAHPADRFSLMQRVKSICDDRGIKTAEELETELGRVVWPKKFEVPQFAVLCKTIFGARVHSVSP